MAFPLRNHATPYEYSEYSWSDTESEGSKTTIGSLSGSSNTPSSISDTARDFDVPMFNDSSSSEETSMPLDNRTCSVCGGPNFFLNFICICDACHLGYHQTCHNPQVSDSIVSRRNAQGGSWFCTDCRTGNPQETLNSQSDQINRNLETTSDSTSQASPGKEQVDNDKLLGPNMSQDYPSESSDQRDNKRVDDDDLSSSFYNILNPQEAPRVFPSTLSFSRHRKIYSTLEKSSESSLENSSNISSSDIDVVTVDPEDQTVGEISLAYGQTEGESSLAYGQTEGESSFAYDQTEGESSLAHGKHPVTEANDPGQSFKKPTNKNTTKANNLGRSSKKSTNKNTTKANNLGRSVKNTTNRAVVVTDTVPSSSRRSTIPSRGVTTKPRSTARAAARNNTWVDEDDDNFDILSLIPNNVVPCMSLGVLAFRDGTIDPKNGQIKRGHVYQVKR